MRVIFDIDGVLADFVYGFTSLAHEMYGSPVYGTLSQKEWEKFDELDKKQIDSVWKRINKNPEFWMSLPALATHGELQHVNYFAGNNDVYFVTSRHPYPGTKTATEVWLRNYVGILMPTVILSNRKGEIANVIKADALLDDKAGNPIAVQYISQRTTPYIVDRPYNQFDHNVVGTKVRRVKSVDEFLTALEHTAQYKE